MSENFELLNVEEIESKDRRIKPFQPLVLQFSRYQKESLWNIF